MRRSEKSWLVAGVLLGLIIAGSIYSVRQYVLSRRPPAQVLAVAEPSQEAAAPAADTASSVELTPEEQKAIGVETTEVKRQTIRKEVVTPGRVAEPETGIGAISARIGGRIDKLFLNVTGETVKSGQPVALIYSPDVVSSIEEYKLALENRQRLSASKEQQAVSQADELVRASRRRLELWGLAAQQIDEMAAGSENNIHLTTSSPVSGIVTKRNVVEGQYVNQGDVLYTVADLSAVWVQADVFESDISLIRSGQAVTIASPALPGALRGTISFLQPSVDPQTRTMTARIQVSNPQMRLRPGMFVQVALEVPFGTNVIAVPRSAVLDAGREKVVYVARENGVFEKRTIEASIAGDEYYAVTKGLEPGERVVTRGSFLIDSQTRLTGNITGMFGGSKAFGTDAGSGAAAGPKYTVTLRQEPSPPKGGSNGMFHVMVTDPDGKPVSDAQVQVMLVMPAMPSMGMGEMRSAVNLTWNGSEYAGTGPIAMAGSWNVTVEARRGGQLLGVYRTRFNAQ
jgi:RND family efflux transporter MFP subunit